MKALQVRCGLRPPRTHDLEVLADTLAAFLPVDAVREAALVLTEYAVDAGYPGTVVDKDEAAQAVAHAEAVQRWAGPASDLGFRLVRSGSPLGPAACRFAGPMR